MTDDIQVQNPPMTYHGYHNHFKKCQVFFSCLLSHSQHLLWTECKVWRTSVTNVTANHQNIIINYHFITLTPYLSNLTHSCTLKCFFTNNYLILNQHDPLPPLALWQQATQPGFALKWGKFFLKSFQRCQELLCVIYSSNRNYTRSFIAKLRPSPSSSLGWDGFSLS